MQTTMEQPKRAGADWCDQGNIVLTIAEYAREHGMGASELVEAFEGVRLARVDMRRLVGKLRYLANLCDEAGAYHVAEEIRDELRNMEEV